MAPEIYDADGNRRDLTWFRKVYGNVRFLEAESGPKFALKRVDETIGTALIKIRVLDHDGQNLQGQPVANRWPDSSLPDLRGSGSRTLWHDRAHVQNTDASGLTGFGLGSGSYIADLSHGGPHTVWVLSPTYFSDGLSGLGMLGGTNHRGPLSLTFQLVDEDTHQPPPGPSSDAVMDRLDEIVERLDRIQADLRQLKRHFGAG
jgi:hypothetical protein